jgi:hypothetical protein
MHVRTNLYSGESAANPAANPTASPAANPAVSPLETQFNQCFQTLLGLVQTANQVVSNSLTGPDALKLLSKTTPPASS